MFFSCQERQHRACNGEEIGFSGQGFLLNKVNKNPSNNELELQRPEITWQATAGGGLMITRAHGCMAHDTTNDLVYLMGGRTDQTLNNPTMNRRQILLKSGINPLRHGRWLNSICRMLNNIMNVYKLATKSTQWAIGIPTFHQHEKSTGQVQIYDLASKSWMNNTTSMPPSMEVGNFGMASIGTKIYIAGGVQNSSGNDVTDRLLEYDTVTGIWTELANMSEKRFGFPLVEHHGLLYAFGGMQGPYTWINQPVLNTSEVYDPSTNTWTQLPNMSFHRFGWLLPFTTMRLFLSEAQSERSSQGYMGIPSHLK